MVLKWDWSIIDIFLGFILDLSDVFTVHICSTRAHIHYLNSHLKTSDRSKMNSK